MSDAVMNSAVACTPYWGLTSFCVHFFSFVTISVRFDHMTTTTLREQNYSITEGSFLVSPLCHMVPPSLTPVLQH